MCSCALAACSGVEGTAVTDDAGDDEGGCLDDGAPYDPLGKADGANTSTDRPFDLVGHLAFDDPAWYDGDAPHPGWSFHGLAGGRVAITADGAGALRLYGPKEPGDAWPLPPRQSDGGGMTATLERTGLYAVATERGSGPATVEVSCTAGPCRPATWGRPTPPNALSMVAVGDLGLTVSDAPIDRQGGHKYAEYHYYREMLEGFYPFLDADISLANLETAVTTGGERQDKTYAFRMPASALEAALDDGFNLFGLANNHAGDFGVAGLLDTMEALDGAVAGGRLLGSAGVGTGFAAAARPAVFTARGVTVALGACGIGYDVRAFGTGVAHVSDCHQVIEQLVGTTAELRILSVHAGVERQLTPTTAVVALARHAVDVGIDVVHGHHPHVVQGIEHRNGRLVFYSMGNFALRGARNMASLGADRDYGIGAKIHVEPATGRLVDVEVVAVYDMHRVVVPLPPAAGSDRIGRLNARSAALGAAGLSLEIDPATGHGYAALP